MKRPEQDIQKACVKWFQLQYPQYAKLLCANYNNAHNATQGGINKAMGVIAGRSDLELYFNNQVHFIEMKAPGQGLSTAQKEWRLTMQKNGFSNHHICRSLEDFMFVINRIINPQFIEFKPTTPQSFEGKTHIAGTDPF